MFVTLFPQGYETVMLRTQVFISSHFIIRFINFIIIIPLSMLNLFWFVHVSVSMPSQYQLDIKQVGQTISILLYVNAEVVIEGLGDFQVSFHT